MGILHVDGNRQGFQGRLTSGDDYVQNYHLNDGNGSSKVTAPKGELSGSNSSADIRPRAPVNNNAPSKTDLPTLDRQYVTKESVLATATELKADLPSEIETHVQQTAAGHWKCCILACPKTFSELRFWHKHVRNLHSQWLTDFEVCRPARDQLLRADAYRPNHGRNPPQLPSIAWVRRRIAHAQKLMTAWKA